MSGKTFSFSDVSTSEWRRLCEPYPTQKELEERVDGFLRAHGLLVSSEATEELAEEFAAESGGEIG